MAKKKAQRKTTALNLNQQIAEAKDFAEMLNIMEANLESTIGNWERLLRRRHKAAREQRPYRERRLRGFRTELSAIRRKRERFNLLQSNRKIPAKLRKRIAELEEEIVHHKHDWRSPSTARHRKKDLQEVLAQVEVILNPPKKIKTKNTAFELKKEYTQQSVTRAYDKYVWTVLGGHFQEKPRAKGQMKKVVVVASLPDIEEYEELKKKQFTRSAEALLDDALSEISELQEEIQEAFDEMPEHRQDGDTGQLRIEAADELDQLLEKTVGVPTSLLELDVFHLPIPIATSNKQRALEASSKMQSVVNAVKEFLESSTKLRKAVQKESTDFIAVLEDQIDDIEQIELPR
ncbi:hypothetical protein [Rosistilla oblonga]|uniref:hypothetical protein n=1 Tax=Rosistilla oblonga TaxID=2527990 RepID=UPI003A9880CA